jgi:hypothetical protein
MQNQFGKSVTSDEKKSIDQGTRAMNQLNGGFYGGSGTGRVADVDQMAAGGPVHNMTGGGSVKAANAAQKAVVSGNSYANDKVPAVLSEGEVVIPRSVMQGGNPVDGAARFVQAVLAKRGKK